MFRQDKGGVLNCAKYSFLNSSLCEKCHVNYGLNKADNLCFKPQYEFFNLETAVWEISGSYQLNKATCLNNTIYNINYFLTRKGCAPQLVDNQDCL